jgi:hypothetical protein
MAIDPPSDGDVYLTRIKRGCGTHQCHVEALKWQCVLSPGGKRSRPELLPNLR